MATLPADRTKLNVAVANQQPSVVASSQANREALVEVYDTVDLLNQKADNLVAANVLAEKEKFIFGADKNGATNITTGADGITKSGFYYIQTNRTGLPYDNNGYLLHSATQGATDYAMQIFMPINIDRVFFRRKLAGVWQPWSEFWHSGNNTITKAASGNIQLANGFIKQWGKVTVAANSVSTDIIFPIAFPNVCIGATLAIDSNSPVKSSVFNPIKTGMSVFQDATSAKAGWWQAIGY